MKETFQILFFAVFIMNIDNSVQYNLKTKPLEEKIGNRFEFHLFENMYGSNTVYRQETNLIKRLHKVKKHLKTTSSNLKKRSSLSKIIRDFRNLKNEILQIENQMKNISSDFPTRSDYIGAQKGR